MKVTPVDERTTRPLPGRAGVVVLDIEVTPSLAVEGRARDMIRELQQARRDIGLDVTDRIHVEVAGGAEIDEVLSAHGDMIREQVLAVSIETADPETTTTSAELADGTPWSFRIRKAE